MRGSSWYDPFGQVRVSVLAISDQIKPDGGFTPESRMLLMINTHLVVALLRVIVGIFLLSLGGPVLSRWGRPPTPRPERELLLLPYFPITSLSLAYQPQTPPASHLLYLEVDKIPSEFLHLVLAQDLVRADDGAFRHHRFGDHCTGPDCDLVSDVDISKHGCSCTQHNVITNLRVSPPGRLPSFVAQSNPMQDCTPPTESCRLSDNDAMRVIHEEPLSEDCSRMEIDRKHLTHAVLQGERYASVIEVPFLPEDMADSLDLGGMESLEKKERLDKATSYCRILVRDFQEVSARHGVKIVL
mmetsp:Transcript_22462/g.30733  ORF Transcript_22462/g.30733 Transcript_22462/m.30733 type:complete len:299 (+) Transcript_22462:721-1617(+)